MRHAHRGVAATTAVALLVLGAPATGASVPASPRVPRPGPPMMSVVVTMADLTPTAHPTHRAPGLARPGRAASAPRRVVRELRTDARTHQAPLVARLRQWRAGGRVQSFRSLWISDSIAVTAAPRVVRRIAARPDVASVTPDRIVLTPAVAPAGPNQLAIGAPTVWDLGQLGAGAVVASLDSGVDATHDDLAGRWRGGTNSWFDPYGQHPSVPTDLTGHGTGTVGVMVGGDSSGTTLGTAPGATWIAARVFDDAGASTISGVHAAFQWLLDPDGSPATDDAPDVVNASWSIGAAPGCDLTFQPDVQALRAAGILSVFPAGNFGPSAGSSVSPANYPEAVSVGAVDATSTLVSTSGRGPSGCGGRTRAFPDVVAPGVDILTTDRWGLFQYLSGTSMAAPHAAGVVALLRAAQPGLPPDQLQDLLLSTARDLGPAGPDDGYGHGLADAAAAYAALPPPPVPDFSLDVAPTSASVEAGQNVALALSVTPSNGFTGDVALSVAGLPAHEGDAAVFPAVVPGGAGTATVTVSTRADAVPGSYPLTVTATSGTLSHAAPVALTITPPPAPVDALVFSTLGSTNPPGVAGTADDADLYGWSGTAYARVFDATLAGLPAGANVDGLDRVDDTHFLVSFADDTRVPGLGKVQDEDVLYDAAGTWSVVFDGTSHGLTAAGADLDAISVRGSTLYFSTLGAVNPPGVGGRADDADVYSWDGTSFTRVWNATRAGLPGAANLDGLVVADPTSLYLSFSAATTSVPGLGAVQDEDVVVVRGTTWSVYFDGTAHGLGASAALDLDAFDLP